MQQQSKGDSAGIEDCSELKFRADLPPRPTEVCQVHLTFSTRDYCRRTLLDGATRCYWHAETTEKYASEAIESYFGVGTTLRRALEAEIAAGRSMEGAYLVKAPLHGSLLGPGSDLRNGIFIRANFNDAHLSYSNLQSANFAYADLENVYLSDCKLSGTRFTGSRLFNAKFRQNDFAGVIGLTRQSFRGLRWGWVPTYRILEEYPDQSEPIYRALAAYFSSQGLLDDASWAAYRACIMRHRLLTRRLSPVQFYLDELLPQMMREPERAADLAQYFPGVSKKHHSFRLFAVRVFTFNEWMKSLILRAVTGYGEKPLRVLWSALLVIFVFALCYQRFGAIGDKAFVSCLYFSAVTFTTVGYGDLAPHGGFRLLAALEALLGILLCGLFLFCLGRRSVGRA